MAAKYTVMMFPKSGDATFLPKDEGEFTRLPHYILSLGKGQALAVQVALSKADAYNGRIYLAVTMERAVEILARKGSSSLQDGLKGPAGTLVATRFIAVPTATQEAPTRVISSQPSPYSDSRCAKEGCGWHCPTSAPGIKVG